MKIENALNYYWKLKVIDSLEQSDDHYTEEERKKLIDNLVDNQEIKDMPVPDNDNHKDNNKFESDQALLNIEQRQQQEQKQEEKVLLNQALDHLKQEYSIIGKISGAITDNELSSQSKNMYTSDQVVHIIEQKYFPPTSNDQVNSVLTHLADEHI
jgi:protease II